MLSQTSNKFLRKDLPADKSVDHENSQAAWFEKDPKQKLNGKVRSNLPTGLWKRCEACKELIFKKDLEAQFGVCPHCLHHSRIDAKTWLQLLFGDEGYTEFDQELLTADPLGFTDNKPYAKRILETRQKSGSREAAISVCGKIERWSLFLTLLDFNFLGGSMGSVVGEKVARGAERALEAGIPYMTLLCTGGARMQEGMLSLMQMAKAAVVIAKIRDYGIPYLVYLADPSTAGCLASFGMVGDVILAEPNALIGFAGPRVIEQTIGEKLPTGFQRATFQLEHGMVDRIIDRRRLRAELAHLLQFFGLPSPLSAFADGRAGAPSFE